MACGDKEACPKGGRPEYRNGPQYELVQGKPQGDRMHAKNEKACGYGLYADEPCVKERSSTPLHYPLLRASKHARVLLHDGLHSLSLILIPYSKVAPY